MPNKDGIPWPDVTGYIADRTREHAIKAIENRVAHEGDVLLTRVPGPAGVEACMNLLQDYAPRYSRLVAGRVSREPETIGELYDSMRPGETRRVDDLDVTRLHEVRP